MWTHNANFQSSSDQVRPCKKELKQSLVIEIKPICEWTKKLPKAIPFPHFPSTTDYDDDGEEKEDAVVGDITEQSLRSFASVYGADKTFGLRDKDGKFCIGNKQTKMKENTIIVGNKEYVGTPGLWEFIVETITDDNIVNNEIMIIMLK